MRLCYGLMRRIFHPNWLLTLVVGIGLTGCAGLQDPAGLTWDPGAAPNYTSDSAWVSLPDREDESDAVPKNLPEAEQTMDSLDVDVFFVHPTQFFRGEHWNAQMDNRKVNTLNAKYPMRLQASAFNIGGRLYAPTYRQAHIGVFTWQDSTSWKALELAYEDVKAAFQQYLDHWNNGRPIILAGHSQGSWHIRWLLQEFFDGKLLQDRVLIFTRPISSMCDTAQTLTKPVVCALGCPMAKGTSRIGWKQMGKRPCAPTPLPGNSTAPTPWRISKVVCYRKCGMLTQKR